MNKILIIQTAFIGDVVLATPIIEKINCFFPNAQLDFLVRKGNESLLVNHPHLHQVLIWNKKDSKYKNFYKLLKTIRLEKYDLVINIQRFLSTGVLTAFSSAKIKVGFRKNPMSFFFNKKLKHELDGTHEVERNLSLIQDLTDDCFEMPKLHPSPQNFQKTNQLLIDLNINSQNFITIAPTSVWFTKQLPAEKWAELIRRLPSDLSVCLIGGPSDFDACENIKNYVNYPNIFNLCGKLNLLESAALMSKATMNYANDSAPIHIASAMNAPMTAVFCSTVPRFGFTPLSDNHKIIETKENLSCRPCGLHGKKACPEGHFKCANVAF
ncbi:MAG: lipopolysaccharide heptosyltransferase II [Cognaticolwellia sp.]